MWFCAYIVYIVEWESVVHVGECDDSDRFFLLSPSAVQCSCYIPLLQVSYITLLKGTYIGPLLQGSPLMCIIYSPLTASTHILHTMEFKYMNTLAIMMCTSTPVSFSRNSLYTPAIQEEKTWEIEEKYIFKKKFFLFYCQCVNLGNGICWIWLNWYLCSVYKWLVIGLKQI